LTYGLSYGRLQLTAFGAQDRWHFNAFLCRAPSAATEAQAVGRHFDGTPSHSRDAADDDALERDRVLALSLSTLSRSETHPKAVVSWRNLRQRHLVMPDAFERPLMLAWLAQGHPCVSS